MTLNEMMSRMSAQELTLWEAVYILEEERRSDNQTKHDLKEESKKELGASFERIKKSRHM